MPKNPLAEIFGYPTDNFSENATENRENKSCPFRNSPYPKCTKKSIKDPLGVCSIFDNDKAAITCPVRFQQDRGIIADAAEFFFPGDTADASLTEMRLSDKFGKSAGNIDIVLATLNEKDLLIDYGALNFQPLYISGNTSDAFKYYMEDPVAHHNMEWPSINYPRPDYLSSLRKRLAPQLMYEGVILNTWDKKIAIAIQDSFLEFLPTLPKTTPEKADLAWFIYRLEHNPKTNIFDLSRTEIVYTHFQSVLDMIIKVEPGSENDFIAGMQKRIKKNSAIIV